MHDRSQTAPRGMSLQVDTADVDEARGRLSTSYCPHSLAVSPRSGRFRATQFHGGTAKLDLYRLSYGEGVAQVQAEPFRDFVLLSRPLRGRFAVSSGRESAVLGPGQAVALDPSSAYRMRWLDGCELLTVRLDRADVEAAIGPRRGRSGSRAALAFPVAPPPPELMAAWNQVSTVLVRDFVETGLLDQAPLIRTELKRLLIAAVLQAYPVLTAEVAPAAPSAVIDRAVQFIEASAADDVTLADIAAAVHTSPRSLQEGFRRHLGTTPLTVLRAERLRRAHQDLLDADPYGRSAVTVSSVAATWGFGNLGRFAQLHREAFGMSPNEALHGRGARVSPVRPR
ncbi:AraC family transcriptional regulator [Herbiconiux moechotypicola]|uniref:AraC family transcriptional regulator n=1 Tax=Herbiconiux moechotypicola TaxID=637393 RepID=A0ABN3DCY2_9MICO|nr:AraC family transcriptional regulator [Herbiconiux moechotypicola]MCS5728678.1 AraC family transcriptional regulator [Herbiconiux moechotypicola]